MTLGKTWSQGFEHCKSAGSQLVKVTDQEELTYIYFKFVKPLNSGSAWMGLTLKNGSFHWTDGSKPGYKNWNYGEPNNFNGREHCVEIYVINGKWNDIPCFVKRPFVCERGVYFLNNTDHFEVTRKTGSDWSRTEPGCLGSWAKIRPLKLSHSVTRHYGDPDSSAISKWPNCYCGKS